MAPLCLDLAITFTNGCQMNKSGTQYLFQRIDAFWMQPYDLRILDVIRRGYGSLLLVYTSLLWGDRHRFFGSDSLVPADVGRAIIDPDTFGLYSFLPEHPIVITLSLLLLGICGLCLIIGCCPRISAAIIMFILLSVHHANNTLFDSEDTVFRLFAFFLIFAPPASHFQWNTLPVQHKKTDRYPAWPLRLFQLQMCLMYLAAGIQKCRGAEWLDGTAVYYALRLDDSTSFHLPAWIAEQLSWIRLLSWGTIAFELAFPILIWFKIFRWPILVLAVGFHLFTLYSMNLHLFHPIMLLGLLSFIRFDELRSFWRRIRRQTPAKSLHAITTSSEKSAAG